MAGAEDEGGKAAEDNGGKGTGAFSGRSLLPYLDKGELECQFDVFC